MVWPRSSSRGMRRAVASAFIAARPRRRLGRVPAADVPEDRDQQAVRRVDRDAEIDLPVRQPAALRPEIVRVQGGLGAAAGGDRPHQADGDVLGLGPAADVGVVGDGGRNDLGVRPRHVLRHGAADPAQRLGRRRSSLAGRGLDVGPADVPSGPVAAHARRGRPRAAAPGRAPPAPPGRRGRAAPAGPAHPRPAPPASRPRSCPCPRPPPRRTRPALRPSSRCRPAARGGPRCGPSAARGSRPPPCRSPPRPGAGRRRRGRPRRRARRRSRPPPGPRRDPAGGTCSRERQDLAAPPPGCGPRRAGSAPRAAAAASPCPSPSPARPAPASENSPSPASRAAISAPKPAVSGASWAITQRPVLATEARISRRVERRQRRDVDDLGRDPLRRQRVRRRQDVAGRGAPGHEGEVAALAQDEAAVERQGGAVVRDLLADRAVEARRLEEHDRIRVADRGEQQSVGPASARTG